MVNNLQVRWRRYEGTYSLWCFCQEQEESCKRTRSAQRLLPARCPKLSSWRLLWDWLQARLMTPPWRGRSDLPKTGNETFLSWRVFRCVSASHKTLSKTACCVSGSSQELRLVMHDLLMPRRSRIYQSFDLLQPTGTTTSAVTTCLSLQSTNPLNTPLCFWTWLFLFCQKGGCK